MVRIGLLLLTISILSSLGYGQSGTPLRIVTSLPATCNPGTGNHAGEVIGLRTGNITVVKFCYDTNKWGSADVRVIGWGFGDVATGSALTTSEVGYITVPFACSIVGWHIMVDTGTATVKVWRVNGGTTLPTVNNSINTSGVAISSGTKIDSTTVSDFTSTSLALNDTLGISLFAVATAKQITFQLDCR